MTPYSLRVYNLHPTALAALKKTRPLTCFEDALFAWVCIFWLIQGYLWLNTWWLYVPTAFFIAGRAGVFLQLAHEAAHGLVGGKRLNQWFGNWMAAYPIGLDLKGYAEPHLRHHACANRACDPIGDREKYRVVTPGWELLGLFLKDACGWTAIRGRYLYANAGANQEDDASDYEEEGESYRRVSARPRSRQESLRSLGGIAVSQLLILGGIFHLHIGLYLLFWLVPLTTAHMVLMRFRGIAEHGLAHQLGITMADFDAKNENGTYYTRSFGTPMRRWWRPVCWLERALIGSLSVYYHHEHHLAPKVPYYHLAALHRLIAETIHGNNRHVYIRGYFEALIEAGRVRSENIA